MGNTHWFDCQVYGFTYDNVISSFPKGSLDHSIQNTIIYYQTSN